MNRSPNPHFTWLLSALLCLILLVAGCATSQTPADAPSPILGSETVTGPFQAVFRFAEQSAHRVFANEIVHSDANLGTIEVMIYSIWSGEANMTIAVTEEPQQRVTLRMTATRLGFTIHSLPGHHQERVAVFFDEFRRIYHEWEQQQRAAVRTNTL